MIVTDEKQVVRVDRCDGVRIQKSFDQKVGEFFSGGAIIAGLIALGIEYFQSNPDYSLGIALLVGGIVGSVLIGLLSLLTKRLHLQVLVYGNWVRITTHRQIRTEQLYEEIRANIERQHAEDTSS